MGPSAQVPGAQPTPSQTVGPFFHDALIAEGGAVLVDEDTRGLRIEIVGRVLDGDGSPVDDAMVEIWQADASGAFPDWGVRGGAAADPHFSGFGRSGTTQDGTYRFETVKPGVADAHPATHQAPVIHVRIFARGLLRDVVTRLYFPDETNTLDPVLLKVDPTRARTLIAVREPAVGAPRYRFDIRLQGEDETVFFDLRHSA